MGKLKHKPVKARPVREVAGKPPYRIPSMAEIAAVEPNGYSVVSTFSGCGGTDLGFKMTGFRTLWANEFIPAAAEVHRLNFPGVDVDRRDIRTVKPEEILERIGLKRGELDVLTGSPPCASFSVSGSREAGWNKVKKYSDSAQRTDDLFFEFARLLEGLQPRAFMAENVRGLVIGSAKGYFKEIRARLEACGYKVAVRVLDARWLGVPQQRQRTIFVGTRVDLGVEPRHPAPLPYQYALRDACPWIVRARYDQGGNRYAKIFAGDAACPPILASDHDNYEILTEDQSRLPSFVGKAIHEEWKKLKPGQQSDKYMNLVRAHPDKPVPCVTQTGGVVGAASVAHPFEPRKFTIPELRRVCGFPDDFQLTGTFRQQWERLGRAVPPPMSYRIALEVQAILREMDAKKAL